MSWLSHNTLAEIAMFTSFTVWRKLLRSYSITDYFYYLLVPYGHQLSLVVSSESFMLRSNVFFMVFVMYTARWQQGSPTLKMRADDPVTWPTGPQQRRPNGSNYKEVLTGSVNRLNSFQAHPGGKLRRETELPKAVTSLWWIPVCACLRQDSVIVSRRFQSRSASFF